MPEAVGSGCSGPTAHRWASDGQPGRRLEPANRHPGCGPWWSRPSPSIGLMPGCSTGLAPTHTVPQNPVRGVHGQARGRGAAVCKLVASQLLTAADRPGRDGAPLSTRARRRPGPAGCVGLRPRERRFGSAVARGSATDARLRRAVRALRPVRLIRVPRAPLTHARSPRAGRAARYRSQYGSRSRACGQPNAAPCARVTILRVCQVRANLDHSDIY